MEGASGSEPLSGGFMSRGAWWKLRKKRSRIDEAKNMSGEEVLDSFWERMSKKDNLAEWRMRLCGMGKEADDEKWKRIAAYRMEDQGDSVTKTKKSM